MKNLFVNKTTMDTNRSTDHYRLSEPTFRHGNFLSRSESADSAAVGSSPQQTKASSLDYRSNNNNQNLTGGGHHQQKGVKKVKCVFLGDARSGKTSLIVSYTTNGYPQNYAPTAFDNFSVLVKVDNQPVQLQICDTAGQAGFDNLRPLCFPNADVFVLCFSVVDPDSFYNLHNKWLPEIRKFFNDDNDDDNENLAPSTTNGKKMSPTKIPPILLIGTQSDRRTNVSTILDLSQLGETVIKTEEALEYAQEIGALAYIECSALTQHNLKEVFDACILASLNKPCGDAANVKKSKIEKARNQYSQEFVNPNAASSGVARKSFKKIKEKMKRSNSVDSAKYASVQVRRQLSSGRINHLGLQNAALTVAKDQLAPSNQEKPPMKKLATTADGAIPSSSAPAHHHNNNVENNAKNSNKNDSSAVISPIKVKKPSKIPSSSLSSSVPQSPSNSKLVKFSLLKSKMSNNLASGQQNNKNDHFGCGGRKMSSKSFDSFSCGNATPKILPKRKLSTKIVLNGNNEGIHGARNNDMMQEIDKLKKGWRKLLCMT